MKNIFRYIICFSICMFCMKNGVNATDYIINSKQDDNVGYGKSCSSFDLNDKLLKNVSSNPGDVYCMYTSDYISKKKAIPETSCVMVQFRIPKSVVDSKDYSTKKMGIDSNVNTWQHSSVIFWNDYYFKPKKSGDDVTKVATDKNGCPKSMTFNYKCQATYAGPKTQGKQDCKFTFSIKEHKSGAEKMSLKSSQLFDPDNSISGGKFTLVSPEENKVECTDIIKGDLKDMIQMLVNVVRVAIPIMLIMFGVLDFSKAVFSFEEGKMKEAQTRFIKRIVAAIAFFLIPAFIGLMLRIGNSIWGDNIPLIEDGKICGIEI